jgi:hypothetical protein
MTMLSELKRTAVPDDFLLDLAFRRPSEIFSLPDSSGAGARYRQAEPFAHLVIDDFLQPRIAQEVAKELVSGEVRFSQVFTDDFQRDKTISTGDAVPPLISLLASKFAHAEMLRYLESVTGLQRLIPDPYYNTEYGYYHIVGSGGVLGSHVDHSHHNTLDVPHVLNLVLYLTENWNEADGGELCLFDAAGKHIVKRVACRHNRVILFACTPTAYHGVEPISPRSPRRRHSLYFAYYGVPARAAVPPTFPQLQNEASNADGSVNYSTYFIVPFWQLFRARNRIHLRARVAYLANLLLPPILMRGIRRIRRALAAAPKG